MADFEAPSFSLGLDLDLDSEPQPDPPPNLSSGAGPPEPEDGNDGDFQPQIIDSGSEREVYSGPVLRRLRRGPNIELASAKRRESAGLCGNVDDEIEEFSSQEDLGRVAEDRVSTQYHSVCSSSKFPLHRHGVLTTSLPKDGKRKQSSSAPASACLEMSSNKLVFPKLTVSPLRRFQLLSSDSESDSDSDDSSVHEYVAKDTCNIDQSSKVKKCNPGQKARASEENSKKASVSMPQNKDFWEDFCPMKSLKIPTPALDEACEEYFKAMRNKHENQRLETADLCLSRNKDSHETRNISKNVAPLGDFPPAHQYFFHEDPRIQNLVRSRLPNFSPLGAVNNRGSGQPKASVIDYMNQFCQGEGPKRPATKNDRSSEKGRKTSKKSKAGEKLNASESFVNPRTSASTPKNAGKRRVHAEGQSSGHWYTASDGRRVYVTKSGQELTGQIAYRHYKKESGARSRKSKTKKTSARKK